MYARHAWLETMLHNKIAICIRTDDVTQSCARTFDEQFGRALSDTCRIRAATREDARILGIHFFDVQNAFVVLLQTKKLTKSQSLRNKPHKLRYTRSIGMHVMVDLL